MNLLKERIKLIPRTHANVRYGDVLTITTADIIDTGSLGLNGHPF